MQDEDDKSISAADPFARRLLFTYLERRKADLSLLDDHLGNQDFASVVDIAHKIYGSGSTYGLDEVSRLGGKIEDAATRQDSSEVRDLLNQLTTYLERLQVA